MIAIIDYGMGNIGSIMNMIRKAGGESIYTADPDQITGASKIILPGVGAFDQGMQRLEEKGLIGLLHRKALEEKVPFLGICLGMQLMTRGSEEGKRAGLGWFAADTVRFHFDTGQPALRVPHMGWNEVELKQDHYLFKDMPEDPAFYFVHSFHAECDHASQVLTSTVYGYEFASALARGNLCATQYHPEKSHRYGLQLIRNFVAKEESAC